MHRIGVLEFLVVLPLASWWYIGIEGLMLIVADLPEVTTRTGVAVQEQGGDISVIDDRRGHNYHSEWFLA